MAERSVEAQFSRAVRLRCPRCGTGKLFAGMFRMHSNCSDCRLKYERAPGYFLGSAYINYGITAVLIVIGYVSLHFGAGLENRTLAVPLGAFCLLFPLFFFRYARSLWLGMDYYFDVAEFDNADD